MTFNLQTSARIYILLPAEVHRVSLVWAWSLHSDILVYLVWEGTLQVMKRETWTQPRHKVLHLTFPACTMCWSNGGH